MQSMKLIALLGVSLTPMFACKSAGSRGSDVSGLVDATLFKPWPQATINICWTPHNLGDLSALQQYLAENISREYARAGITIQGWKACPDVIDKEKGPFPFKLDAEGNFTNLMGYLGREEGVNLNIQQDLYEGYPVNCAVPGQNIIKRECILSNALHEMGHFVGLDHEHDRLDTGLRCGREKSPRAYYRVHLGDYDERSIMNYCVDNEWARGRYPSPSTQLTPTDVASIKAIYDGTAAFLRPDPKRPSPYIDQNELTVTIVSEDTVSYRYQVVHQSGENDFSCKKDSYSKERYPASKPISVDLSSYTPGRIKVCVLGTNKSGQEQNPEIYSAVSYVLDRTPWATIAIDGESFNEQLTSRSIVKVGGEGVQSYTYKVVDISKVDPEAMKSEEALNAFANPCSVEKGYSSSPLAATEAIPLPPIEPGTLYLICVRGIDAKGQMQSLGKASAEFGDGVATASP